MVMLVYFFLLAVHQLAAVKETLLWTWYLQYFMIKKKQQHTNTPRSRLLSDSEDSTAINLVLYGGSAAAPRFPLAVAVN